MRVLIVDDSAVMRKIVGAVLRGAGLELCEVFEAADGTEGIDVLERLAGEGRAVDLVLCDLHMPVLDGLGFLKQRAARRLAVRTRVVMVTADTSDRWWRRRCARARRGSCPSRSRQTGSANRRGGPWRRQRDRRNGERGQALDRADG